MIYKGKGTATDPDNYRGILVSDHLGKILTSLLQAHLNTTYEKAVGVSQYGAVKHRGTAMASLVVRSFLDLCSVRSWSCFVLFVDLSKAFDYAIREVVMGWMPDAITASIEEKRALLEKLGVPERASRHLAEWIDTTGGLLALSGADPAVCELVTSLHHGAWFRLPGDEPYIVSVSGGRQGCKLGALVFNLIYSLALLMLRQELLDLGIILWVTNAPSFAFWGTQATLTSWAADERSSPVFEVTYVDDECIFFAASSARAMMLAIPKLMRCLCMTFQYFGFQINWKPGKTESFVILRGHRSVQYMQQIRDNNMTIKIADPSIALRVVSEYKHLGSMVSRDGNLVPDAVHRSCTAMASYCPLSAKIFACRRIARQVRIRLFMSLVVSRLLYNVHVWSHMPKKAYAKLNAVYMRGLRRIADAARFRATGHGSDLSVRQALDLPSLQCLIAQRRLLLLSSLLRSAPPHLISLLSLPAGAAGKKLPWVQLVLRDLDLFYRFHETRVQELGPPSEHPERWEAFIIRFPGQWKSSVKRLHLPEMQFDAPGEQTPLPAPLARFTCPTCSSHFPSEQALASHRRAKHGDRTPFQAFLPASGVCPVCRLKFSSRPRLLAHAIETRRRGRRKTLCSDFFQAGLVAALPQAEIDAANRADRLLRGEAQKRGLTQPRSTQPVKKRAVSSTVPPHASSPETGFSYLEDVPPPPNAVAWEAIRPTKRLRTKVSLDVVALAQA